MPPTPGSADATADKRVKDAQAALTKANQDRATLRKTLESLGWKPPVAPATLGQPAAGAPPVAPAQPAQPPATPSAPAPAPAGPQRWEIADEPMERLFKAYSEAPDDKGALRVLLNEAINFMMQAVPQRVLESPDLLERIGKHQPFLDTTFQHFQERISQQGAIDKQVEAIEAYWKESLPNVPAKFLWNYSEEAGRLYPGDISEQALHCVKRVLEELGPMMGEARQNTQLNHAIQQGQGAVLPGGSGLPAAGGGEAPVLSFVDQLKQANRQT